ncbi:MAG: carbohydrate binding domain-containing protein [Sedimentisphaerales bacterium]|nr:carbohydrate binding domain-containing protein [Sedimentisphaerales bacterium]
MKRRILTLLLSLSILTTALAEKIPGDIDTNTTSRAYRPGWTAFVIPAQQNADSVIAIENQPIGTDEAGNRITAVADRFYRDDKRIKIWGVNFSFGGNFPTHDDAAVSADRLAAAGINSVRCHHMDTSRYPSGLWHPANGETIYPEAMDRLDYYIAQLAAKGIFINLNLHVGRKHSQYLGLPESDSSYDKIVGIFTPALVQAQKDFAREMLDHVNPYRGLRYAEDPAVAFVEITNEDSFFMWGSMDTLRNLPTFYADVLQQIYNDWLQDEYGDTNNLRITWNRNVEMPGQNVLTSFEDHFNDPGVSSDDKWYLEEHEGCQASFTLQEYQAKTAARFVIDVTDDTSWHLQLKQRNLQIVEGQYYTLSFEAAAEQPRTIWCNVMQEHSPWSNLGLYQTVEIEDQWQSYSYGFVANSDDTNGRVTFSFGGGDTTTFYLTNVQLYTGGQTGLMPDESIEAGTVRLFVDSEVQDRRIDRLKFLVETEKAYFDDMRSYIKDDLGCDALVTGTIVFGPLGMYAQSDMDFIDAHAYWQHPRFPGTPWDPEDWYIRQKPMTDYIDEAPLFALAACRLGKGFSYPGKPFTVSEYNHAAPLDSQAACVPMITSFAAAQDWDGLWIYAYTHSSSDWNDNYFNGFFDILHNPAKWGFVSAGAAIFRYAGIEPVGRNYHYIGLADSPEDLASVALLHLDHDGDMFDVLAENSGFERVDFLDKQIANTLYETGSIDLPDRETPTLLGWDIGGDGEGIYSATGKSAWVYIGHRDKFASASGNSIQVTEPNYAAVTITSLQPDCIKLPVPARQKMLITACGRCENTAMIFSEDRTTVGTNWGEASVQIELVSAVIRLPSVGLRCYALAPDGTVKFDVPVTVEDGRTVLEILPAYGTMWYLLTASGDLNDDGKVAFADFCKLGRYWQQDEPSLDTSPLPFGDGIIDEEDLAVLCENWLRQYIAD